LLKDTDPAGFHPHTGERTFDLTSVPLDINEHLADVLDLEPSVLPAYYSAYRRFMAMTRSNEYLINYRLVASEMVVFDNRRVLHGREAFEQAGGNRHLHGCYVDRADWDSRLWVLARVS